MLIAKLLKGAARRPGSLSAVVLLEQGEAKLDRLEVLAPDEPELARDALPGLLRQVGQLVDAGAKLRRQLVDELAEREDLIIWPGHAGGSSAAGGAGRASTASPQDPPSRWRAPGRRRRPRPRPRPRPGRRPGSDPASAARPRAPRPPSAGRRRSPGRTPLPCGARTPAPAPSGTRGAARR